MKRYQQFAKKKRPKSNEETLRQLAREAQKRRDLENRQLKAAAAGAVNTKKGICPQCGSRNIKEIYQRGQGDSRASNLACCVGCGFFWPLMLLAPFLGKRGELIIYRQCRDCGNKWRV